MRVYFSSLPKGPVKTSVLVLVLAFTHSSLGQGQHGTLVTTDGGSIHDTQLADMLEEFIPSFHSSLLVFTQCYGGNFLDDFEDWEDTVVLTANAAGQLAYYGGYDDDAAHAIFPRPGRSSDDVHTAGTNGKAELETPQSSGGTVSLADTSAEGPIKSRHVLVYAGQPGELDELMATDIILNFDGAENTTVTTVMGNGSAEGWDYPATVEGLRQALTEIGEMMNADEQFILFVTDHGGHSDSAGPLTVPDGNFETATIETTPAVIAAMTATEENDAAAGFLAFLDGPLPDSGFDSNNLFLTPNLIDDFTPFVLPFDLNGDGAFTGPGEGTAFFFPVPEDTIIDAIDGNGLIEIGMYNDTGTDLNFSRVSLESGPIPQGGITDLSLRAVSAGLADFDVPRGSTDVVLHELTLTNQSVRESIFIDRLDFSLDAVGEVGPHIRRIGVHHDVDGNGIVDPGDPLLSETFGLDGPAFVAEFPPVEVMADGAVDLVAVMDLRSHPVDGFFDVNYTHDPGASTCGETIDPYTVPADFRVVTNGVTRMDVVFPDAPEPIAGLLDPVTGSYVGETPFVPAGPGLEASEAWDLTLFDPAGVPVSFEGRSEVTFRMLGSDATYCRRIFEVSGEQRRFDIP